MIDPLGPVGRSPEANGTDWILRIGTILLVFAIFFVFLVAMTATSGCVTLAKNTAAELMIPDPEPTPEPTPMETPIITQTPVPEPTESIEHLMARTNGYFMRDWLHMFRGDVQGINGEGTKDLSQWFTVYGYKMLPVYHYHSVSWGTHAFFLEKPDPGMQFLFIFVNFYADGDDVRSYIWDTYNFAVAANGRTYYPETILNPNYQIQELDNCWNYAHTDDCNTPYPYKIIQEAGTGIIRAEKQEVLYGGRSNAMDGYIVYQVPLTEVATNFTVLGSFANLGGNAWWKLV